MKRNMENRVEKSDCRYEKGTVRFYIIKSCLTLKNFDDVIL